MKNPVFFGLSLVLSLVACTPTTSEIPIPPVVQDTLSVTDASSVKASAEVVPSQETHLSFVIPGKIDEISVENGFKVEAGQTLATLDAPDLEFGILQAEAKVREAEYDFEYWKLPRRVGNQVVNRGAVAEQELEMTRRSLDTARAEFFQTQLIAPFAATIVSVEIEPGEFVQPGQVVIIMANLDNLKIETTDLSELNVAAVKVGQPATVFVEALNEEFNGKVSAISPISNTLGGDVVFKVTVELDEQPADLLWGMSADVEFQTEQ